MYKTVEAFDILKKAFPHCSAIDDNIYKVHYKKSHRKPKEVQKLLCKFTEDGNNLEIV